MGLVKHMVKINCQQSRTGTRRLNLGSAFRDWRLNGRRDVINQAGLPEFVRGGRIRKTGLADSKAFPKALDEARA